MPRLSLASLLAVLLLAASFPPVAAAQGTVEPYFEFLMALHLESQGDTAGAEAALQRAARADAGSAEIRAELASFYLRRSRREDAEKAAREALTIDGDNVEAHRVLGLIYAANADAAVERRQAAQAESYSREAISHLERVASQPSADINLQYTLGRLYLRAGQPENAVDAFERVLNQNPNSVQGRLAIAQAYAASNNLPDAIISLREIVDDEPRVAAVLGQYQEQAGQMQDAAESYGIALTLNPRNRELKFRRASALLASGDLAGAAAAAMEAQSEHPDDARFPRLRARALFDGGSPAQAYAVLEDAVAAFPRDVQTRFALAAMYSEGGRSADAVRSLRQLLDIDPGNAPVLNYLGYLLAESGEQLDEAISLVKRALAVEPDNPAYLDSLGWAYYQQGDMAEAEKYLAPAAEKLPRNSVIQEHYGDLKARRGRWAEAIELWTRALDGDGDEIDRMALEQKIQDARARVNQN